MADRQITELLGRVADGPDGGSADELYELIYGDLRRIARSQLRKLRPGQTLQTTALVNEAFLRLVGKENFESRGHFFAVSATAMRQILIDHARRKGSLKRGGDKVHVSLDKVDPSVEGQADLVLTVDAALSRLKELDPRWVQVVECRFFAGYSEAETAEALGVSIATAQRDWIKAKAWLRRELDRGSDAAKEP
ncbi:MAG: sigma-70 family RNA polymerase sigma factor [Acidobacteriota bacterium]